MPTFFMKDEEIVEVVFSRWAETSPGQWEMREGSFEVSGDSSHVIFELPVGCFELQVPLSAGTIVFSEGDGARYSLYRCRRPQRFTTQESMQAVS